VQLSECAAKRMCSQAKAAREMLAAAGLRVHGVAQDRLTHGIDM